MQKDQPVVCPIEALQLSNDEVLTCIGEMSTREMDPQRVNISGNEAGLISGFHFG